MTQPDPFVRRSAMAARILSALSDAIEDESRAEQNAREVKVPVALSDVLELLGGYLGGDVAKQPRTASEAFAHALEPKPERRSGVEPKLGTRFAREAMEVDVD